MSYETGTYEAQIGGYAAFVPKALPSGRNFQFSSELYALISRADRALARLDGSIDNLPDPDLFVLSYIRKEAVISSQIEGTQASLSDILKAEAHVLDLEAPSDVGEVVNHVQSLRYGMDEIKSRPITTNLICEMHAILMSGVRGGNKQPGEIRSTQNWIGADGTNIGGAVFVPPPPRIVRNCLADLERFINEEQSLPLLVKIALVHAQFETIHPFLDGNGRVGRMLIPLLLGAYGAISKPVLYISHHFRRHKDTYVDRLQATRDQGDLNGWVSFFLEAIIAVSEDATRVSRAITQLREEHRNLIIREVARGAASALKLHERLFRLPVTNVNAVSGFLDVTFPAANSVVKRLEELGILVEITGNSRNRAFMYESYYRLFEPTPAPPSQA